MSLAEIFTHAGVQRAHIIDDAYDIEPIVGANAGTAQAFVDALEEADFDRLCELLGMAEAADSVVVEALGDADVLAKVFDARDLFAPHSDLLFGDYLLQKKAKLAQVAPLVSFLEQHGIVCQTFGSDYPVAESEEPQLVFIDLRLREDGPVQVNDAVAAFNKLKLAHGQCRPFVFLMSSLQAALQDRREEFRSQASLFTSQFEALEKNWFNDPIELEAILAQYVRVLPQLRELHQHVEGVGLAVQTAARRVQEVLRTLDLADYFVLHRNTVSIEKVGLGTYISDLLLEYLVHEVENTQQMWDFAKGLDDWKLENLPRSRFGLTPAAGTIYSGNLLHAKVRLERELERKLGPTEGYFYLGDIFFLAKELNEAQPKIALVIATPACDLVRPTELKKRTIFLCEGSVKAVTAASVPAGVDGLAAVVMPHPKQTGKQLLIKWNKKKLHTWHREQMEEFAGENCHWVRAGRLRPLYAIQLQHAITADLSRIGVQRAPNVLVPHGIEVFVKGERAWVQLDVDERTEPSAAALADSEDGKKTVFIVSDPTVRRIRRKLEVWLGRNPNAPATLLLTKAVEAGDFDQRLMYLDHAVPQIAEEGKTLDISGYPMSGAEGFTAEEWNAVAYVRPGSPSPYVSISGGQTISDQQNAALAVKFVKINA